MPVISMHLPFNWDSRLLALSESQVEVANVLIGLHLNWHGPNMGGPRGEILGCLQEFLETK